MARKANRMATTKDIFEGLHKTKASIVRAFKLLGKKNGGQEKFGPTELGEAAETPLAPSLVSSHLKGLVTAGIVERCPQGTRRALYRLVERPEAD